MSTDPVHDPLPRYSFLPWARRGVAASIDQVDHLGATPAAGPAGRATVSASLRLETVPAPGAPAAAPAAVSQTVDMVGPGDVKAFRPDAVLRVAPAPGARGATPGELAVVEFYDEDFPWRYTPARATADHRLRPWIALLVLAAGEYSVLTRPGELSILVVADGVALPPPTESWAWAHVQTSGDLGAVSDLDAFVRAAPDHALARLMSPRRLRPLTDYRAFVVPAFETGRLAGLGSPDATVPAQRQSWGDGQPARFPVLYDWSFRTSEVSDFESLARRPKPFVAGQQFGKRPMDMTRPGAGLPAADPADPAQLEGALQPIGFQRVAFPTAPGTAMRDALQQLVDRNEDYRSDDPADQPDDPVITPPAYARLPAGVSRVADAAAVSPELDWLAELNTDPRNRAAAGLGAQIVRDRDEELMARAWAQVEELSAANQRLREAELAMTTTERIFAKHVSTPDPDRLLILTAAAQSAIAIDDTTTVRGAVDASRIPVAAQSTAFRRIARPQRTLMRALDGGGLRAGLIDRMNRDSGAVGALSSAPPAPEPGAGISGAAVAAAATAAAAQQAAQPIKPREQYLQLAYAEAAARSAAGTLRSITDPAGLTALRTALNTRLDAAVPAPRPPVAAADPVAALRTDVQALIRDTTAMQVDASGQAVLSVVPATFDRLFGSGVDGKTYRGVTAAPVGSALENTATTADRAKTAQFISALGDFAAMVADRPNAVAAAALSGATAPNAIAVSVGGALNPRIAMPARIKTILRGVDPAVLQGRRLIPVMAHPRFPDPLFEPLRQLSQDYVLPNISDLGPESIAVMQPNDRFIESVMAGASAEMARELLWNEFPTDQRGTYFSRFWDARDAGVDDPPPDIVDLVRWSGALGGQSGRSGGLLVLVVRAELLVKFPNTVVFAQHGSYVAGGRTLQDGGDVKYPVLRGHLDPDIELYGFELSVAQAAGSATDAGYFFCFMERPGQVRFGLDMDDPPPALATWDDLAWADLKPAGADYVVLGGQNAGLAPTTSNLPAWNATAAHQAAILAQSPVLLARHATDMLPPEVLPHDVAPRS